jgi:DNA mismatch repair protein MutS
MSSTQVKKVTKGKIEQIPLAKVKVTKEKVEKVPIIKDYLEYYDKYSKLYGKESTVVFMQVGGFYEAYSLETTGPDLLALSKLTGVIRTRKNKGIKEISLSNHYILGFPLSSITKYTELLLENDYVIVIIDHTGNKKDPTGKVKGEERCVSHIYSKGTYIESTSDKKDGNYIACIYLSNEDSLLCAGMSGIDVSTGHVYIHEACSTKFDESYALDEVDRFMSTLNPSEILIYYDSNQKCKKMVKKNKLTDTDVVPTEQKVYNKDYILTYLKLNETGCRFYENVDSKYTNCIFQNEIFKLVYTDTKSLVTPIEQLDLEKHTYINTALCLAFDFIHDKNAFLINDLIKPNWFTSTKKLVLGNNAIRQLDITEDMNHTNKCKFRSLFHVVNKTSTALGNRYLRSRLLSPLIDPCELNLCYTQIDNLMHNDFYKDVELHLDSIKDIERLQRKMGLRLIRPMEISMLTSSYESIFNLIMIIKEMGNVSLCEVLPSSETVVGISNMLKHIDDIFVVTELDKYAAYDFKDKSIFNDGIHPDVDNITDNVNSAHEQFEEFRDHLDGLIKTGSKKCIQIKKHSKDGYFLALSRLNGNKLKEKLVKLKVLNVGKKKIESSSLIFNEATKITKIFIPQLDQVSEDVDDSIEDFDKKFTELSKKYFLEEMLNIYNLFYSVFKECNLFISKLDFLKSSSKVAHMYGYTRPTINMGSVDKKGKSKVKQCSYVDVKKLRHPIIERLIDYEYVPHDICLGKDLKGMMLFGVNSSGKSSAMKAIGLSIVMGQSGMFVPAESFEFYPYESIFTRITGDDNIFRGLSSFTLEMVEVNAILKRSGENTLVIGDEVCRGTEHISGTALVAATILKLAKTGSTFIFATHLHEVVELKKIKELTNVKSFHIAVSYDEKTKSLIYDRTLKEGTGNQLYGITVAQYIIQDKEFIDDAVEIKNELLGTYGSLVGSGKGSHFNSNVIIHACNVCGKKDIKAHISYLEVHHIGFQKDCVNGFVKDKKHIKKNQEANLCILCTTCHDKVHDGELIINGYKMSSKGKTLMIEHK